jgi:hypothetical protein
MADNPELVLTKWAVKWLRFGFNVVVGNTPSRAVAKKLLNAFDAEISHPDDYVVAHTRTLTVVEDRAIEYDDSTTTDDMGMVVYNDEQLDARPRHVVTTVLEEKKSAKLKRGCRSKFAMAIAKRAYLKFGARPVSEANVLVTRKWLTKLLEDEYKDLRTCDKVLAVDRGTFLSFIPTMAWNDMRFIFKDDNDITRRIGGESLFSRIAHWVNPSK